jgi:predicted transcriptional regulator of viral defense system
VEDVASEAGTAQAPRWDDLYELAASQQGVFTNTQAHDHSVSAQLIQSHLKSGNIRRLERGIYRFERFPESQRIYEDNVVIWLRYGGEGTFSHETALQFLELTDALPGRVHLTLPSAWKGRKIRHRDNVQLYFDDVPAAERTSAQAVPVTNASRTLTDLARAHGDESLVEQGIRTALRENKATVADLAEAAAWLARPPNASRVRPLPDSNTTWIVMDLSGTRRKRPRPDWRMDAEDFASRYGGRLREAAYYPTTQTQYLAVAWPAGTRLPDEATVRADAAMRFDWQ